MPLQPHRSMKAARTRLLQMFKLRAAVTQQPLLAADSTCRVHSAPAAATVLSARRFIAAGVAARAAAGASAPNPSGTSHPAVAHTMRSSTQYSAPSPRPTPDTVGFSEDLINAVHLTGVVLKGPTMAVYSKSGSRKAVLVLGLYERATGDRYADMARPVLVEAWNAAADALKQQVTTGAKLLVKGHLALDYRPEQSSSAHGPALLVKADTWSFVAENSLPHGRHYPQYQGDFDPVFLSRTAAATTPSSTAAAQQPVTASGTVPVTSFHHATAVRLTPAPAPRFAHGALPVLPHHDAAAAAAAPQLPRRRLSRTPHHVARDLLLQGRPLLEVAAELGVTTGTVIKHVVEYAEQEGPSSQLWPSLIAAVQLNLDSQQQQQTGLSASHLFDVVQNAIQEIGSDARLKPIREYLLSGASGVADAVQLQEAGKDGAGLTYNQLKVLLAIRKLGVHPNQF